MLRTYTTELLRPYWTFEALLEGLELASSTKRRTAVSGPRPRRRPAGWARHRPDLTLVCLRWEDLDRRLNAPLQGLAADERAGLAAAAVAQLVAALAALRAATSGAIVVTLLPRGVGPSSGSRCHGAHSEAAFGAELERRPGGAAARRAAGGAFDDLDGLSRRWAAPRCSTARLWHTSRFPFSPPARRRWRAG